MNTKTKFYLSEGLMMLAFAYGSEGRILASIMTSITATLIAINANSFEVFKRKVGYILIAIILEICLIQYSSLLNEVPTLIFLITCNTSCAFLWIESEYESIEGVMKLNLAIMALLYTFNIMLSHARFNFTDMFLFISLIFLPLVFGFIYKCIKEILSVIDFDNSPN